MNENGFYHRLLITGSSEIPQQISSGVLSARCDMATSQEEADVIIPQQVCYAASHGATTIIVICDDTDVFLLLLHYYFVQNLTCNLFMGGTSAERSVVDIAATVRKHSPIITQLLAAHAISGCDTVAQLSGLGKATIVKNLLKGPTLEKLSDKDADIRDVIAEATRFIAICYGKKGDAISMSDVRYDVWLENTGRKTVKKTPKLQSFPPTSESFSENIKRAYFQTCVEKCTGQKSTWSWPNKLWLDEGETLWSSFTYHNISW